MKQIITDLKGEMDHDTMIIRDGLFNKWYWENRTMTYRRMIPDHFLTPYIKINTKWMKYVNVRQ